MPLLSRNVLEDTLRRLPTQAIRRVLRHGVVPVAWQPDQVHYAICGPKGAGYARRHGLLVVARIALSDFHHGVRRVWGRKILAKATHGLSTTRPQFSARKRVTLAQGATLIILALCLALSSTYLPASAIWVAASAALGLFFLSVIALRLCCLFSIPASKSERLECPADADLPTYSVLVPVFRETSVLSQLLRGLSCLNYPPEKLEIKIIVEEFDTNLRRALEKFDLPPRIEVIVVPHGSPQTKPRALNYALQFCHGRLLTIYDAEDVPEPNQLRGVAREFLRADETLACLQAQLTAYFPSKEKLFATMVFEDKRRHAERLVVLGDETRPVAEVLRDIALKLVTLFQTPESLAYVRLVVAASGKFPEIGRSFYEAGPAYTIGKIAAYLETKMTDGTLKRRDPRLTATQLVDLVQSGVTKPCLFGIESMADKIGKEAVVDSAISLFLDGMKA